MVPILQEHGLEVTWDGTFHQRPLVSGVELVEDVRGTAWDGPGVPARVMAQFDRETEVVRLEQQGRRLIFVRAVVPDVDDPAGVVATSNGEDYWSEPLTSCTVDDSDLVLALDAEMAEEMGRDDPHVVIGCGTPARARLGHVALRALYEGADEAASVTWE